MTRQHISLGATANDGSGDKLRSAGQKINETFIDLYRMLGGDSDVLTNISFDSDNIIFPSPSIYTLKVGAESQTGNNEINLPDVTTVGVGGYDVVALVNSEQTLYNKTLDTPSIISNDKKIQLEFDSDAGASAVNYLGISNAATGNEPSLKARGTDANITSYIQGKGSGGVKVNKLILESEELDSDGAISTGVSYTLLNSATSLAISLNNGFDVGEKKTLTNKGAGAATITPTNFANGTSFTINSNTSCEIIWDGSNWNLISAYSDSDLSIT